MNNKKIQANMQINVGFVADTTQLVKSIESKMKQIDLGSSLASGVGTSLDKQFKDIIVNLEKMMTGLGKRGLSLKQYDNTFNTLNDNIKRSVQNVKELGKELSKIYNSKENQEYLNTLKEQQKALEKIEKLGSKARAASTRASTNVKKAAEYGIDLNNQATTKMLDEIISRRGNNQGLTPNQQRTNFGKLTEEELKKVITLYKQENEQLEKRKNYIKEMQQLSGSRSKEIEEIIADMQQEIVKTNDLALTQEEYNAIIEKYINLADQLETELNTLPNKMNAATDLGWSNATREAEAGRTLSEIAAQFGFVGSIASNVARTIRNLISYSFDFYKDLDSALNQIYVVSSLTANAVNGLTNNFIHMAKETGMSIDDVTRAAVLFYQQGLNTDEVMQMTEVTAQFAKVAGTDATDAADKLTAAVNGYCLSAEDAMSVADKFNKVAAASAANIDELSTAFSKAAAQANQAGVSMDNYLAYIATMEEATREAPENLGTSLKTIFSRMQQIKTGDNTEDTVDINSVETALRSVGIALRDTQGQLRDLEEIFAELGPKWNSLNRNTQAYLGTIIAGTRQQSRFITLMQNWDRVLELSEESANSAGQQSLMHAKAMDSIESKLKQLTVAWQEFVSNLANSKIFKVAIEGLTKLINLINKGNQPISLMVAGVSAIVTTIGDAGFKTIGSKLKGFFEPLGSFFSGKAPITEASLELNALKNEMAGLNKILQDGTIDLDTYKSALDLYNNRLDTMAALQKKVDIQAFQAKMQAAGAAMVGLGVVVGNFDQNLGGLISTVGSLAMAFGMLASNPVGAIITALVALYQAIKLVSEWSDNLKKKMTDAIDSVNKKLDELGNKVTEVNEINRLLSSYDKLSKKIYRTAEEQEKLNDTIQKIGDIAGVEVYADELGNLQIDLTQVNDYLDELEQKRDDLKAELRKEEIDSAHSATSGFFNNNSIDEYYTKMFTANRSKYRSLLKGIDDGLKDEERTIGSNAAKTFNESFKKTLIKEVERNKYSYLNKGFAQGMEDIENNINSKLSKAEWNELYTELNYLQNNVNNMSFNDVQESVNNFYNNWSARTNLAAEEWEVLKNSIINTVFENSSMLEFFDRIDEMMEKAGLTNDTDSYYSKRINQINEQIKDIDDQVFSNTYGGLAAAMATGAVAGATAGSFIPLLGTGIGALAGAGAAAVGAGVQYLLFPTEEQKKYKALTKAKEELAKQEQEYLKTIQEEHSAYLHSEDDARRWITAQYAVKEALADTTGETQKFLSTITSLYDTSTFENWTPEQAEEYANYIKKYVPTSIGGSNKAQQTNIFIAALEEGLDDPNLSDEIREKIQSVINEAYNNLQLPSGMTWTQMGNELKDITKDFRTLNKLIAEFNDQGYLTLDQFMDLADILDGISFDDLLSMGNASDGISYLEHYIDILDNLNFAFDENTGAFLANGEAIQNLQDIQQIAVKSKIQGMINELKAAKVTYQAQMDYIDAQIAANEYAMEEIKNLNGQEIETTVFKDKVEAKAQTEFEKRMTARNDEYVTDLNNLHTWTIGVLNYTDVATQAWARYWEAVAGNNGTGKGLAELKEEAEKSSKEIKWEAFKTLNLENEYGGILDKDEQAELYSRLEKENEKLATLKSKYQGLINGTDAEIKFLENLMGADLSKLGAESEQSKLDHYIGKLKEVYNILNRINMLEHRLSMLDEYTEVSKGEEYGKLLQERLSYNEQLLDQYKFLTDERKKQTNGYKEWIQSIAGLEGVFDFDKYGQIIINWERYLELQDDAADGETTLKQKADDVYEAYTNMLGEVQDYLSTTIDYYKKVIEIGREMVDSYISLQDKAAEAVKEIYQQILDTKLDAIDKEKDAIDELREARARANKEQKDAKEVAGIQSDIQRAMMDTSGASASALIKSQSNLDDKLNAIAEDKYSEMLDDIIKRLDEEKESLQQEFDDMFDDLTWLFSWLDDDVMNDFNALSEILKQTQDWREKSELERMDEIQSWHTQFNSYYEKIFEGEKGIYDIYDKIKDMEENIADALDGGVVTDIATASADIWQTLESWKNGNSENVHVSNASELRSSINWNAYRNANDTDNDDSNEPDDGKKNGGNKSKNLIESTASLAKTQNVPYRHLIGAGSVAEIRPADGTNSVRFYSNDKTEFVEKKPWYDPNVSITDIGVDGSGNYYAKVKGWGNNPDKWIRIEDLQYTGGWGAGTSLSKYAAGGFATKTGFAWLDGTFNKPEAVLNPLQTEHFMKFTNALDNMYGQGGFNTNSSVTIDTISFNVESMSSPEDGEKAFNMFVNKFNEIGSQTGIKFNNFKNTL